MDDLTGSQFGRDSGEFALGPVLVSPALRCVSGPGGRTVLEPLMMQVLVQLARWQGRLVTRAHLVETCWMGAPVGDDSVNRAIAGVRRAAREAGRDAFRIETVAGSGYVLKVDGAPERAPGLLDSSIEEALAQGWRVWRMGLPAVNLPALDALRAATRDAPERADAWGLLALLARHAVEHAGADECPSLVFECEAAAERALALSPGQPDARAAMAGLWPIYGDWARRRDALLELLDSTPGHPPAQHDLVVLEMSTGRPSKSITHLERLHALDPLAAIYHYKLVYQYWTLGRLQEAERVGDRAMQMWPRHPAIWFARFYQLAFSGNPAGARLQLEDESNRPPIPAIALSHLQATVASLLDHSRELRAAAVAQNLEAAGRGPAQCVHALVNLSGLGEIDSALDVARGYYLRTGPLPVGIRKTPSDPTVNELHRRATQPLFIPTATALRTDPRFLQLCEDMGLVAYWEEAGVTPDFLA